MHMALSEKKEHARSARALLDEAQSCIPSDLQKALSLLNEALSPNRQTVEPDLVSDLLANRAQVKTMMNLASEAWEDGKAALERYRAAGNRRKEASVLNILAIAKEGQGDYTGSFLLQQECLGILQELDFPEAVAQVTSNMGLTCTYLGDWDQALELYQKSLSEWDKLPEHKGKANLLVNLGFAHSSIDQFDQALDCYDEALCIYGTEDPYRTSLIHANIATALIGKDKLGDALKHAEVALEESKGQPNRSRQAHATECMGVLQLELGNTKEARKLLEEARNIYCEVGLPRGEAISLRNLAKLEKESPSSSAAYLLEAERIARQSGMKPILIEILGDLHEISRDQGRWKDAHEYLARKTSEERSMVRESTNLKLKTLEMAIKLGQSQQETERERIRATELAHALREAEEQKQRAEEESRQKSEMLNFAAHDLRNLIWGVTGPAELIAGEKATLSRFPEIKTLVDTLQESAIVLEDTLQNVLNAAAIDNGKLEASRQRIRPLELLRATVEHWQSASARKEQSLVLVETHADHETDLDPKLIKDCLHNLISNAIKYSPLRSKVTVGLEVTPDTTAFYVADQGPGLTEDDKRRMGRLFQTLSAKPTNEESSVGVGLAIVKQFSELHGGRLEVDSPESGGSIFRILLPR